MNFLLNTDSVNFTLNLEDLNFVVSDQLNFAPLVPGDAVYYYVDGVRENPVHYFDDGVQGDFVKYFEV